MRISSTKEYKIWKSMKSRCYSASSKTSKSSSYSRNGIFVCDRWRNSFLLFLSDMGHCPDGLTLDRIDNSKGYFPENCRWTSKRNQSCNRGSFNKFFTYNGETKVLKDWARYFKIKYTTLHSRIFRSKYTFHEAIKFNNN